MLLRSVTAGLRLCAVLLSAGIAHAALVLEVRYPVLEALLAEQIFTQEGRRYVRGNKDARCSFAYLSNPKMGSFGGKLAVRARFTGRSAVDLLGRCVGLGDDFDLTVLATPHVHDGKLALKDVTVDTQKDSFYIRRVRKALAATLARDFVYPLLEPSRKVLERTPAGATYKQEVADIGVSSLQVIDDALVITLDLRMIVK